MADYFKHQNYFGPVEFSAEDAVLHGKIIGINDLVTFEANSVEELQQALAILSMIIEKYVRRLEKNRTCFSKKSLMFELRVGFIVMW